MPPVRGSAATHRRRSVEGGPMRPSRHRMVYAAGALALMSTLLTASPAAAVPSLGSVPDAGHLSVDPLMRHLRALQAATDRGGGVRGPRTAGVTHSAGCREGLLHRARGPGPGH